MSTIGVPSMRSAPLTTISGPSGVSRLMLSIFTHESATGFGRKLERVAKTPRRLFPPSLGGRTVGLHVLRMFSEKIHMIHKWLKPSRPRSASALRNSGSKRIVEHKFCTSPLCRGMPNFSRKSLLIRAMILNVSSCICEE